MNDLHNTLLPPGDYLVELAFAKPVSRSALVDLLHRIGWETVVLDEVPMPAVGAISASAMRSATTRAPAPVARAPMTPQRAAILRSAMSAPSGPNPAVIKAAVAASPTVTAQRAALIRQAIAPVKSPGEPLDPFQAALSRKAAQLLTRPLPGRTSSADPVAAALAAKAANLTRPATAPSADAASPSPSPSDGGGGGGGGGDGGGGGSGDASAEAPPEPTQTDAAPAPPAPPPLPTPEDFQRALDVLAPGTDPPASPLPGESPTLRQLRLANLWRRWTEWGSPFARSPSGDVDTAALDATRIAGEDGWHRVRFIGRLTQPQPITPPPGMAWIYVRRLAVAPFSDLTLRTRPWQLMSGRTYEFRVLARDKAAPTAEDIKKKLGEMGFAPMKLAVVKRNIRLPGRPTSLSLWYGIGQWMGAPSVVTIEDPLFFEEVQEVVP